MLTTEYTFEAPLATAQQIQVCFILFVFFIVRNMRVWNLTFMVIERDWNLETRFDLLKHSLNRTTIRDTVSCREGLSCWQESSPELLDFSIVSHLER